MHSLGKTMKTKTFIHPTTEEQLKRIARVTPQSLLIFGERGVGLTTIVNELATSLEQKPQIIKIVPDSKGTIKIESIRELRDQLRTKASTTRMIFIDEADTMTQSSQNGLLKILEEPPLHTLFVLTTHTPQHLLPTIRSRTQQLYAQPLSAQQTEQFIKQKNLGDPQTIRQVKFLAQGLPAEISRLIEDHEYMQVRAEQMKQARDFITQNTYQKLVLVSQLGNDRAAALRLISDVSHIVRTSLRQNPGKDTAQLLKCLLKTEDTLRQDGHVKTQLLRLIVA